MTDRNFLTYGLVLIVVVLVLAFVNFRYIQPGLKPVLAKAKVAAPKEGPSDVVDKNIVAATMEKIKTMFPGKKFQKEFAPRRVKRNPFLWPGEAAAALKKRSERDRPSAARKGDAEQEARVSRLQMIIIGEHKKIALIDSRFVYEGDKFNGDIVRRIDEDKVILRGDTGETRLYLDEYTFASAGGDENRPGKSGKSGKSDKSDKSDKKFAPADTKSMLPVSVKQQEIMENLFKKLEPLLQQQ